MSTTPPAPPRRVLFRIFGVDAHMPRPPRRFFNEVSGGQALYPLIVLVGLRAVEQLDQTAFGILGPEIRDHFGLSNGGFLAMVAVSAAGGLLLTVPFAYFADRKSHASRWRSPAARCGRSSGCSPRLLSQC